MSRKVLSDQFDIAFPAPGTSAIPEGHVRLFHYTGDEGLKGIKKSGLKVSSSQGDTYGEPNVVWASAQHPSDENLSNKNFVEFHVDPSDLDIGKDRSPEELTAYGSNVTSVKDIPRENIVAFHQPWHSTARELVGDDRTFDRWVGSGSDESTYDEDADKALQIVRGLHRGFQ